MNTYRRQDGKKTPATNKGTKPMAALPGGKPAKGVRIDGKAQVLDMLLAADPDFRESLLRRISAADRELGNTLRAQLTQMPRRR